MTPICDVNTCTKKSVHVVYKILPLPTAVGKVKIHLCPQHFNEMMPNKS